MKSKASLLSALLVAVVIAGCSSSGDPQVEFKTSLGDFVVETWPDKAPVTSDNFLQYVVDGHFDGLTFHRVAPGFVVQGGGFLPDHTTLRPTRAPIVNEAQVDVKNEQWTLSMARTQDPDSATSQFFINLADNPPLDKTATSPGYAVFGRVISGFDTVEAMTEVEPGQSFGAGGFFPKTPIVIESASIISGKGPDPSPPPTPADVHADLITAGKTRITASSDRILVWAQNAGQEGADLTWDLTGLDGAALPDGWSIRFEVPQQAIGGVRTQGEAVYTMLEIDVPEDASGTFELELHTGLSITDIEVEVALDGDRVSTAGDSVTARYSGRCTADGTLFDEGEFPLTLGTGRAIPGFDLGLFGLQEGEAATLTIPAPMAYGHDGGPCAGKDPADLEFEVMILSFDN